MTRSPSIPPGVLALADAWEKNDEALAAATLDHAAAAEARGHRELVCDLIMSHAPQRELLTALHAFGRLLAERGASPSILSVTIDGAREALDETGAEALGPSARAAVTEGYFAAATEAWSATALRAWDPPACIAKLPDGAFAVSAHLPSREPDDVSAWATRIARMLKKERATRVFVDGDPNLVREVQDAILLAGLDLGESGASGSGGGGSGSGGANAPADAPNSSESGNAGTGKKRGILSKILG